MLSAVVNETAAQAAQRIATCAKPSCPEPSSYRGVVQVNDESYTFAAKRGVIAYSGVNSQIAGSFDAVELIRSTEPEVVAKCAGCLYVAAAAIGALACYISTTGAFNECRMQCLPCPVQSASFTCGGVIGHASCVCQSCSAPPRPRTGNFNWGPLTTGGSAPFPTTGRFNNGPFVVGDGFGWIGN